MYFLLFTHRRLLAQSLKKQSVLRTNLGKADEEIKYLDAMLNKWKNILKKNRDGVSGMLTQESHAIRNYFLFLIFSTVFLISLSFRSQRRNAVVCECFLTRDTLCLSVPTPLHIFFFSSCGCRMNTATHSSFIQTHTHFLIVFL